MIELLEHRIAPATFIVTNLDDAGPGSLRDAIDQANDRNGADVILFKKGLTGLVQLTTGEIEITDKLTVKGPGASALAISGSGASRIFNVSDGANDTDSSLSISGLEFLGGRSGSSGGAIQSEESLKIRNCAFHNNQATTFGGAVMVFSPEAAISVDIRNTVFAENQAGRGGAVLFSTSGPATFLNNTFIKNTSTENGGAISGEMNGGKNQVKVVTCEFIGNEASESAGAAQFFVNEEGSLLVRGSSFIDNHAINGSAGALFAFEGKVTIEKSEFSRNSAALAGGALELDMEDSNILIRSCNITDNSVLDAENNEDGGGGIKLRGDTNAPLSKVRIQSSVIASNSVTSPTGQGFGGGISISDGDGTVRISGCKITNNISPGGGGFSIGETDGDSPDVVILGSQISGNSGSFGGGIAAFGDGALLVQSSSVFQNSAINSGGGLFLSKTVLSVIAESKIFQNESGVAGGGLTTMGELELRNSSILENSADELGGGIRSFGSLTLNRCTVSGNFAPAGSGITHTANGGPPIELVKSRVTGNFGSNTQVEEVP